MLPRRFAGLLLLLICMTMTGFGQGEEGAAISDAASTGIDAAPLLSKMEQAFSQGRPVISVSLSGDATWTAGSLHDPGTVSLSVSGDGVSNMKLDLASLGSVTESASGTGPTIECHWSAKDGKSHDNNLANCWKPFLWFLPAFSLQPSLIPNSLGLVDLGLGRVGSDENDYRQLRGQFVFSGKNPKIIHDSMQFSTSDLGVDPTTYLPATLAYSLIPDRGSENAVSVEIRYARYTPIAGVQIPFSIQRFVNGTLQLEINVRSAQVN